MLGQPLDRMLEARIEPLPVHELKRVDRELEVDQPARSELDVERPGRRLVAGHVLAHFCGVGASLRGVARRRQDRSDRLAQAAPAASGEP